MVNEHFSFLTNNYLEVCAIVDEQSKFIKKRYLTENLQLNLN